MTMASRRRSSARNRHSSARASGTGPRPRLVQLRGSARVDRCRPGVHSVFVPTLPRGRSQFLSGQRVERMRDGDSWSWQISHPLQSTAFPKARVERSVPSVREDCFGGEVRRDLPATRVHAVAWCRDDRGIHVHTRAQRRPREHFEAEEQAHLRPRAIRAERHPALGHAARRPRSLRAGRQGPLHAADALHRRDRLRRPKLKGRKRGASTSGRRRAARRSTAAISRRRRPPTHFVASPSSRVRPRSAAPLSVTWPRRSFSLLRGRVPCGLLPNRLDHEVLDRRVRADAVMRERPVDVVLEPELIRLPFRPAPVRSVPFRRLLGAMMLRVVAFSAGAARKRSLPAPPGSAGFCTETRREPSWSATGMSLIVLFWTLHLVEQRARRRPTHGTRRD